MKPTELFRVDTNCDGTVGELFLVAFQVVVCCQSIQKLILAGRMNPDVDFTKNVDKFSLLIRISPILIFSQFLESGRSDESVWILSRNVQLMTFLNAYLIKKTEKKEGKW